MSIEITSSDINTALDTLTLSLDMIRERAYKIDWNKQHPSGRALVFKKLVEANVQLNDILYLLRLAGE